MRVNQIDIPKFVCMCIFLVRTLKPYMHVTIWPTRFFILFRKSYVMLNNRILGNFCLLWTICYTTLGSQTAEKSLGVCSCLPRDHGVLWSPEVVLGLVDIRVADPTVEHLQHHIFRACVPVVAPRHTPYEKRQVLLLVYPRRRWAAYTCMISNS